MRCDLEKSDSVLTVEGNTWRSAEIRKGDKMLIIAGLGNPGKEYENTRHNAGFMVMDALAEKIGADISEKTHKEL